MYFVVVLRWTGLTLNEGPAWLEQRKFMLKTLKNLGFGKSSLENVLADELETLLNYLKSVYCFQLLITINQFPFVGYKDASGYANLFETHFGSLGDEHTLENCHRGKARFG